MKKTFSILITTAEWNGKTYLRATFNQLTCTEENVKLIFDKIIKSIQ